MSHQAPCCRESTHLRTGKSPFSRVIALDWYDGPRAGLLQCGECGREFRFELLDEVINDDEGQDVRIFSLAPLPTHSMERLSDALSRYQTPVHPVWVPLWQFPTAEEESTLDRLTDQILDESGPPELAIATPDLMGEIVAAKAITTEDLAGVADGFSFLGIVRKVPAPPPRRASR
jgi:hypothetical protein